MRILYVDGATAQRLSEYGATELGFAAEKVAKPVMDYHALPGLVVFRSCI